MKMKDKGCHYLIFKAKENIIKGKPPFFS